MWGSLHAAPFPSATFVQTPLLASAAALSTGDVLGMPVWAVFDMEEAALALVHQTAQLAVLRRQGFAVEVPCREGVEAITLIFRWAAFWCRIARGPCAASCMGQGTGRSQLPAARLAVLRQQSLGIPSMGEAEAVTLIFRKAGGVCVDLWMPDSMLGHVPLAAVAVSQDSCLGPVCRGERPGPS